MTKYLVGTLLTATLACHAPPNRGAASGLPGTEGAAETTSATDSAATARAARTIYQALYAFGSTRREVRDALGTPVTARADTVSNRHVAATDSIIIWTYQGLEFHFYWATPVERELLLSTRAVATHPRIAGFVGAVRTPGEAQSRLGVPAFEDAVADTTRLYFLVSEDGLGVEDSLILSFVSRQLAAVTIAPYVD